MRFRARRLVLWITIILLLLYVGGPLGYLVTSSLITDKEIMLLGDKLQPPSGIYWGNIQKALSSEWFTLGLFNSVVISLFSAMLCVLAGSVAGYAFARVRFPRKREWFAVLLVTQTLPGMAMIIPIFLFFRGLGLFDTQLAVVLAEVGFIIPYAVWLLFSFFRLVPPDIEEAALVDGCGRLEAFVRVILPVAKPGLMAVAVYAFMLSWGDLLFPLVLTTTRAKTISVVISEGVGQQMVLYGYMSAQALLSLLPPVILAIVFGRYLITGLTAGAVKG